MASSNETSAQREFDLKSRVWFQTCTPLISITINIHKTKWCHSRVWFQTKIARPEVQLPLYYIHFEIAQYNSLNANYKILVSTITYWASSRFVKKRIQKCVHISFWKPVNVISTWLRHVIGCFVLLSFSHWLRKRCDLEQKIVQFGNKWHHWKPIRLQG